MAKARLGQKVLRGGYSNLPGDLQKGTKTVSHFACAKLDMLPGYMVAMHVCSDTTQTAMDTQVPT